MYKFLSRLTALALPLAAFMVVTVPAVVSAQPLLKMPVSIMAADEVKCKPGEVHPKHYDGEVSKETCCPASAGEANGMNCFIAKYINPVIALLSGLVGVVVLSSVIVGAIQYSSAGGDSGKVAAAKQRIINSLLALAAFIFLFAFLQWIIPGGIDF